MFCLFKIVARTVYINTCWSRQRSNKPLIGKSWVRQFSAAEPMRICHIKASPLVQCAVAKTGTFMVGMLITSLTFLLVIIISWMSLTYMAIFGQSKYLIQLYQCNWLNWLHTAILGQWHHENPSPFVYVRLRGRKCPGCSWLGCPALSDRRGG